MQWGGTIGGPVIKDRAHFFGSLERVTIDTGITVNVPARPEFNTTTTTETRVWNTIARFDHQLNASNTWGVRWLREYSPQFNQIIGAVTLGASREEDDLDQTVVGTVNTVLGNTHVNTLRLGWTQEDVSFANPCFNGNGRDQAACLPTLAFQTFTDQQSAVAQARVNDAYQVEDTHVVVPARQGRRSRHQGRRPVSVLAVAQQHAGQLERDVLVRPEQRSVQRRRPANLSRALLDSRAGTWRQLQQVKLRGGVRAGQVEAEPQAHAQPRAALRPRDDSDPRDRQPALRRSATRRSTATTSSRVSASPTTSDGRSVARGGYGRFYDKTHFELIGGIYTGHRLRDVVRPQLPAGERRSGTAAGSVPDGSVPRQRSGHH